VTEATEATTAAQAATPARSSMSVWGVASLGVGSMVGAGIFTLLGEATLMTGRSVYLSFAVGGAIALLSGYSYARLAARYPGSGGIMEYFDRAFSWRVLSGGLSILFLIGMVIALAMMAKTFGAYAARLAFGDEMTPLTVDLFSSAVLIVVVLTNMAGSGMVSHVEEFLVGFKLVILAGLMAAGLWALDPTTMAAEHPVPTTTLFASVGLTFFAYAGYGIMANASGFVANPAKTVPRAIFIAIIVVATLYIGLAVIVLGHVPADHLARYQHTAVAQAARRVFGGPGFVVVSIAALLATTSALNASLFSGLEISKAMAARGELPALFARAVWRDGTHGLVWTAVLVLVMINLLSLSAICHIAGAACLILYLAVFVAHWRLHGETGGSRLLIALGALLMLAVLVAQVIHLWEYRPEVIAVTLAMVVGSLVLEWQILKRCDGKDAA
jgi:amino acid transporter